MTFKAGDVGFRITLFFHYLHQAIQKSTGKKDLTEFAKLLDSNHGCLSAQQEDSFQQDIFKLQEVDNLLDYYKILGIENVETDKQLHERLVQAIKNSRNKGYHGEKEGLKDISPIQ